MHSAGSWRYAYLMVIRAIRADDDVICQANEKALNETVGHLTIEKARLDRDLSTRQLIADQEIMLVQQSKASVEAANASLRQDL